MKNLGRRKFQLKSSEGHVRNISADVAGNHKVLFAVSTICDKGHRVVFEAWGGEIIHIVSGQVIKMVRKNGVYVVQFTLQPAEKKNKDRHPGDLCAQDAPGNGHAEGIPAKRHR